MSSFSLVGKAETLFRPTFKCHFSRSNCQNRSFDNNQKFTNRNGLLLPSKIYKKIQRSKIAQLKVSEKKIA